MTATVLLVGAGFLWLMTSLGAAAVFFPIPQRCKDLIPAFSAGVMLSASFWSLLSPCREMCPDTLSTLLYLCGGFIVGVILLVFLTRYCEKLERDTDMLSLCVTLHNLPEGLAVGVALGAAINQGTDLGVAFGVCLAIGIQNLPEGTAIALPLRAKGHSKLKCFFKASLTGAVEPVCVFIGAVTVSLVKSILPFSLAFSAGAMVFVVFNELMPVCNGTTTTEKTVISLSVGFFLMMLLDTL